MTPLPTELMFKLSGVLEVGAVSIPPLAVAVPFLDKMAISRREAEEKFISTLIECAHDPFAWYKVRQQLENEFRNREAVKEMVAGLLKFLDNEFLPES